MNRPFDAQDFQAASDVSRGTMENIRHYAHLLAKWQKQINLVSNSSLAEMWLRHFYDSFQLKTLIAPPEGGKLQILDIGSGAGFPGLLLSMLDIGTFHMVESNNKKCAFMRQVIRETKCDAVVHNARAENLTPFHVDYIVSRACAPLDKLFDLGRHFIAEDTVCLFLKGGIADREIAEARKTWRFTVEKFTSVADESGIILKVTDIKALQEVT